MDPVIAAAWITAGGVVLAAIIVPLVKFLSTVNLEIFPEREASDETWFRDMKKAEELIFLGTSHVRLNTYLYQHLQNVNNAPLRSIEIYYASSDLGRAREKAKFSSNMRNSRHDIAALVCGPEWLSKFPSFESVHFKQVENAVTFSGSVINCNNRESIVYVVQHPFKGSFEADESITFRYAPVLPRWLNGNKQKMLKKYLAAYEKLKNNSLSIGKFRPSLWDRSVKEWSRFSVECNAHRESMNTLVGLVELQKGDKVLDLASGSGHISSIIVETNPDVSLTVLDSSPGMIKSASTVLGDKAEYALCKLPDPIKECNIDAPENYDAIFIHLAIPSIASDENQLSQLAKWCLQHLKADGCVLLCAHNTALDEKSEFSVKNDILRDEFNSELTAINRADCFRPLVSYPISPDTIRSSFESAGFTTEKSFKKSFHMSMRDRILMWSAPVVLNSIMDVDELGQELVANLIEKVRIKIENNSTPDMTVTYWMFRSCERV